MSLRVENRLWWSLKLECRLCGPLRLRTESDVSELLRVGARGLNLMSLRKWTDSGGLQSHSQTLGVSGVRLWLFMKLEGKLWEPLRVGVQGLNLMLLWVERDSGGL